jgi:hypothetical protein
MDIKSKEKLLIELRAKLYEKKISRSSKKSKEDVVDKTFKDLGIDKDLFMKELDMKNKQQKISK